MEELFLTRDQVMAFYEAFNTFDQDKSGSIDTTEFGDTLRGVGYHPSEAEIADMIDEADEDASGALDFIEFLEVMARRVVTDEEHDMSRAELAMYGPGDPAGEFPHTKSSTLIDPSM